MKREFVTDFLKSAGKHYVRPRFRFRRILSFVVNSNFTLQCNGNDILFQMAQNSAG